jgi:methyl-accepting chemotaxis protein
MSEIKYTAMDVLEIKGSFMYFILLLLLSTLAAVFQLIAGIDLMGVLRPLVPLSISIVFAFIIFRKKKSKSGAGLYPWLTAFITISIPVASKYSLVKSGGWTPDAWTFAAESYNSSILLVIFIVMLQLLHNRQLFIVFALYGFINWIVFFVLAWYNGAEMFFLSKHGSELIHGVIILREVFYIIVSILIAFVSYRNIPIIHEFISRTQTQTCEIESHLEKREEISREIKESMGALFQKVEELDRLVEDFNERINEQSATFEEISATLEELEESAGGIHDTSVLQLNGNIEMESIINNYKAVKNETMINLDSTDLRINSVMEQTNTTNERIGEVENAMNRIKEQGELIRNTTHIIVEIADQINLLSLNASIEAARAGEQGKGFAVVADEIGKLAFRTSESIKEIEHVVAESDSITSESVGVINTTAEMIRKMIADIEGSTSQIQMLKESIITEENYIDKVIIQMAKNIELARSIGLGTEEQKRAIMSSNEAVQYLTSTVNRMVENVRILSESSGKILESASKLHRKSKTED